VKLSRNLPIVLSIACGLAVAVLVAAPAAACFVCDNNQCRELDKHTESEIGFPNCIDGVDENGPYCHVSGFPCITPPGGLVAADLFDLGAAPMSPLSPAPACAAPEAVVTPLRDELQSAELL